MVNSIITQQTKEKLFRMLLLFFPYFKFVKLRDNSGILVLRKRNVFSKSIKISISEALLYFIPNEISLSRWGNYDYTSFITSNIVEILNSKVIPDNQKYEACVNYLYSEFLTTKIVNIYSNINEVIVPLEQGYLKYSRPVEDNNTSTVETEQIEDAKIVKGTSFFFLKNLPSIQTIRTIVYKSKALVAGLVLTLLLNYEIATTTLPSSVLLNKLLSFAQACLIQHQEFQWTIARNTS